MQDAVSSRVVNHGILPHHLAGAGRGAHRVTLDRNDRGGGSVGEQGGVRSRVVPCLSAADSIPRSDNDGAAGSSVST